MGFDWDVHDRALLAHEAALLAAISEAEQLARIARLETRARELAVLSRPAPASRGLARPLRIASWGIAPAADASELRAYERRALARDARHGGALTEECENGPAWWQRS